MANLVSIIVPVHGVEDYLRRCVDSLLNQSYSALEIILVDDGSPDACGEICDAYSHQDPRVRVIHQANAGQSVARNAALEIACGDFLVFVDADDWVHTELVSSLLSILHETNADIAVCHAFRASTQEVPPAIFEGPVQVLSARGALELYAGPLASLMTAPWAKLYRSSLFEGIRFPAGRVYEDVYTTYRVVARARRISFTTAQLYYYFIRPGSTTERSQNSRHLLDLCSGHLEQAAYFQRIGLEEARGVLLKKAFLVQRHIRREVQRSGDTNTWRRLKQDTRRTAALLWSTRQPLHLRVFAAAYIVFPGLLDALLDVYRWIRTRLDGRSRRTHSDAVSRRPDSPDASGDGPHELEVIVVGYGSPEMLRAALEPVVAFPVTVVDNSSLPAIRELCGELGCRYIDPGRNGGFAAGVNIGLANLENPENDVLLLNPDAVIRANDVEHLHAALRADPGLASVGPRQVDESGAAIRVAWPFPSPLGTWLDAVGLSRLRPRAEYVSGAILLLRAEAIADVGHFDDRFFLYAEEADWQYRARLRGWRHQVIDSVTAMHAGGATSSDERKRQIHFHASHERFLRKHHGTLGWQAVRLGQIAADLIRAALRTGTARERLLARSTLYRRGPMRAEQLLRPRADAGPTHSQREVT